MRDTLKNLFSNQINLEDNSQFYYTISPYELTNALGSIILFYRNIILQKRKIIMGNFSANYIEQKKGIGMILNRQKLLKIMQF